MKKISILVSSVLLTSLTLACNEAKFFGSAPEKATNSGSTTPSAEPPSEQSTDLADPNAVSCTVAPTSIKLGRSVTITVKTKLTKDLLQTIKGAASVESKLKSVSGSYVLESGEANLYKPTKEGKYTVEIRHVAGGTAAASCSFKVTPKTVTIPECKDGEKTVGAHFAFLIDNSNSNAATDCPSPVQMGVSGNAAYYKCQSSTNREKAVLTAYDILDGVAKKAAQASAVSSLAIASFPTRDLTLDESIDQTNGFVAVTASNRTKVSNAMAFSREPFGRTPYGAAMSAGANLFSSTSNDGKSRVAVLVTDGEPTDQDPSTVLAQANSLRSQGVEIITVFVTGKTSRTKRQEGHKALLTSYDSSSIKNGKGHWYASAYASLSAYTNAIFALPVKVAGTNQVVEVSDSSALESVFMEIIESKAIRCEK